MTDRPRDSWGVPNRALPLALALAALAGLVAWFVSRGRLPVPEVPRPVAETSSVTIETPTELLDAPPVLDVGDDPAVVRLVSEARDGVTKAPRSAGAWGRLGQILLSHDLRGDAAICLAQAEALDPREPRWPYLLAIAWLPDDHDAALPAFRRAVALAGGEPKAIRLRLAEVLLDDGETEDAEALIRRVLEGEPGEPRALLGLGRVLAGKGEWEAAAAALVRALDHPCARQAGHLLLARIYERLGRAADATAARARAEGPEDPPWPDPFADEVQDLAVGQHALIGRAGALLEAGRVDDAMRRIREVNDTYPGSAYGWILRGKGLIAYGNLAAAEDPLRRALACDPRSVEAHFQLGYALALQDRVDEAIPCLREAVAIKPDCSQAHYMLGRCWARKGETARAIASYRETILSRPQYGDVHRRLGEQLIEAGCPEEALAPLRYAVQLDPSDGRARELLDRLKASAP